MAAGMRRAVEAVLGAVPVNTFTEPERLKFVAALEALYVAALDDGQQVAHLSTAEMFHNEPFRVAAQLTPAQAVGIAQIFVNLAGELGEKAQP